MKRKSIGFKAIIVLFLVMTVQLSFPAMAATKKSQALAAYRTYLEGRKGGYVTFSVIYLNNDSVPELVVNREIFTWKNGSMIRIKNPNESMYMITGYYKKKGILVQEYVHGGYYPSDVIDYAKMSGTALTVKLEDFKSGETNISTGKVKWGHTYHKISSSGSQKITKSAFNKALKKLVKTRKKTKIKAYENTETNRAKQLK